MKYFTYILKSEITGKYYIGHTQDLRKRLSKHNSGQVKATKSGIPWRLVYYELFDNRRDAFKRELQIKRYKGGKAFKKLVNRD